jgi:DNA-binding response OmpR family regulator
VDSTKIILESETVSSTLKILERENPDVLLLDIQLPDGTGFDILGKLLHMERKPVTIVLTNFAAKRNRKKCFELGADFFFDKSLEFEKIIGVINELSFSQNMNA